MTPRSGFSRVLAAVLIVVLLIVVTAVAVFLSQGGTSPSSATSAVNASGSLAAFVQSYPQTACAGQAYSNSSLTINWGNVAPGTKGIQYMCLENTGTAPVTLAVTSTLSPSVGKITSPQAGSVLNPHGILQVELDLWLSSSVQPGPLSAFTITVGAEN